MSRLRTKNISIIKIFINTLGIDNVIIRLMLEIQANKKKVDKNEKVNKEKKKESDNNKRYLSEKKVFVLGVINYNNLLRPDFLLKHILEEISLFSVSTVILLLQGLRTKDLCLFEHCLNVDDKRTIYNTCRQLPVLDVIRLLKVLLKKIRIKAIRNWEPLKWIRAIIIHHTSYLIVVPGAQLQMKNLYSTIENRLHIYRPLLTLIGRLDFIISQIQISNEIVKISNEEKNKVSCTLYEETSCYNSKIETEFE